MRILIVEDEYNLADVIKERLVKEKYLVDIITDGEEGLYMALEGNYDLIILDVMLPNLNGFEILKELNEKKVNSKIIMLTAKSMLEDKLTGLNGGANDYITKPFHIDELIARINIQLKKDINKNYLEFNDLRLDLSKSKLKCLKTNEEVELVLKEYELLEYFMNNPEQVLSKNQLYSKVWGIDEKIESNNLEVYLSFLRRKLKAIGTQVNIKSLRGLGYKLEVSND